MTAQWPDEAYGEGFAEVYDDWYHDVTDVAGTVSTVVELVAEAGGGPVLELGVGTGRVAVALAAAGLTVHGIDNSPAMVARLRAKPGGGAIEVTVGDMVTALSGGPYAVILATYNTVLNLADAEAQARCFEAVARHLAPGGWFVVETSVFAEDIAAGGRVEVRSVEVDRVVLSVTLTDPSQRLAKGQFLDISADGTRMRPWRIRWSSPAELDQMAIGAGLELAWRAADWNRNTFGAESTSQVSAFRLPARVGWHPR